MTKLTDDEVRQLRATQLSDDELRSKLSDALDQADALLGEAMVRAAARRRYSLSSELQRLRSPLSVTADRARQLVKDVSRECEEAPRGGIA